MIRFSRYSAHFFKFLLLTLLLSTSFNVNADHGIHFLGQPTTIMDRDTGSGQLLSSLLDEVTQQCLEESLAETRDKLHKKLAKGEITEASEKFLKERAKRYFKCLKKAVKDLKKSDAISKDEAKELKAIVKQSKKAGIVDDPQPVPLATVNGRVTTPDGQILDGVDILASSAADSESDISIDGAFSLRLDPDTEYVLRLSRAGLADQVLPVMSPADGQNISLTITMIPRGAMQSFTAGSGVLTGDDGASVDVNGVSWVDADGNPVNGEIIVTVTPVDVSNSATLGAFPGEFSGVAAGASEAEDIVSYGVVEFEFSQNGQAVQPTAGQLVDILIPIYFANDQDGNPFVGGETIPLWSLDEDSGIWQQDGVGTVVASPASPSGWALAASVGHFSWWNCDVSMNAASALITVFGAVDGTAVIRAVTNADIGWRPGTVETVAAIGETVGPLNIPSTGEVCFSADITYADGSEATTLEDCRNPLPNGTEVVDLFAPTVGPLNIATSPAGVAGVTDVAGFAGFPVDRVRIFPTTSETTVTYSIVAGSLPTGLTLTQTTATRAEIAGIPIVAGIFSVTVQGDDGSETDTLVIDYDISSDVPPPMFFSSFLRVSLIAAGDTFDLNSGLDSTIGGAPDSWMLLEDIEGGPVPPWLDLDPITGILTLNTDTNDSWFGRVKASNLSGEDEVFIEVCAGLFCEGGE